MIQHTGRTEALESGRRSPAHPKADGAFERREVDTDHGVPARGLADDERAADDDADLPRGQKPVVLVLEPPVHAHLCAEDGP